MGWDLGDKKGIQGMLEMTENFALDIYKLVTSCQECCFEATNANVASFPDRNTDSWDEEIFLESCQWYIWQQIQNSSVFKARPLITGYPAASAESQVTTNVQPKNNIQPIYKNKNVLYTS